MRIRLYSILGWLFYAVNNLMSIVRSGLSILYYYKSYIRVYRGQLCVRAYGSREELQVRLFLRFVNICLRVVRFVEVKRLELITSVAYDIREWITRKINILT